MQGQRHQAREDQVDDRHRGPNFDRPEIAGHDFLPLPGQLRHADHDEQRRILQADDALVAQRRNHAPEGDRPDDVQQDLVKGQAHCLPCFLQSLVDRQQRSAHDFRDVRPRVDDEGGDRREFGVHPDVRQQRQRKVDEHDLHHDRRAADDRDVHLRDAREHRVSVGPRHARKRAEQETARQAPEGDLDGHERTRQQIG
ncbi:hypothetical protein FI667_g5912, partial [Globisporangium splendens]